MAKSGNSSQAGTGSLSGPSPWPALAQPVELQAEASKKIVVLEWW